jgi:hypothetical protein
MHQKRSSHPDVLQVVDKHCTGVRSACLLLAVVTPAMPPPITANVHSDMVVEPWVGGRLSRCQPERLGAMRVHGGLVWISASADTARSARRPARRLERVSYGGSMRLRKLSAG